MRKVPCKKKGQSRWDSNLHPSETTKIECGPMSKLNAGPCPLCTINNLVPASKLTDRAFQSHRTDKKKRTSLRSPDRRLVLSRPQGFPLNAWGKKNDMPVPCPARRPRDLHPLTLVHTSTSGHTHEIRTFLNAKVYHGFQGEKT